MDCNGSDSGSGVFTVVVVVMVAGGGGGGGRVGISMVGFALRKVKRNEEELDLGIKYGLDLDDE